MGPHRQGGGLRTSHPSPSAERRSSAARRSEIVADDPTTHIVSRWRKARARRARSRAQQGARRRRRGAQRARARIARARGRRRSRLAPRVYDRAGGSTPSMREGPRAVCARGAPPPLEEPREKRHPVLRLRPRTNGKLSSLGGAPRSAARRAGWKSGPGGMIKSAHHQKAVEMTKTTTRTTTAMSHDGPIMLLRLPLSLTPLLSARTCST